MLDTTTPNLLPCPFCGSTRVSVDDSVGGVFVSCDLCEARGPFVDYTQVNYPASMFRSVSVAPNGDTIDPPLTVVGRSNDEYRELRQKARQEAEAAATTAWNQRNTWQPIETAPRDGTLVLTISESRYLKEMISDNYRLCNFSFLQYNRTRGAWVDRLGSPGYAPTHWQALP